MRRNLRNASASRHRGRRPPPNYQSRSVQAKLLMLLGLLMAIVFLMREAREPTNWQWLWQFQLPNAQQAREADIDTRVRPGRDLDTPAGDPEPLVHAAASNDDGTDRGPDGSAEPLDAKHLEQDPLERARIDAWSQRLEELAPQDRQQLLRGLKSVRDGQPPSATDRSGWQQLVGQLDQGWQRYLAEARRAVAEDDGRLTAGEKQQWSQVLDRLHQQWQHESKPALAALAEATPPGPEHVQDLTAVQAVLDAVLLNSIEDNTVFRPAEKDVWFRLLEDLSRRPLAQLQAASSGTVGFLQLYQQPDEYRGQLVTVKGLTRLGYYREAPENSFGIDGYYVFWLKPLGGNSPIVVYSLEVPEGFPDVRATESRGRQSELEEEVEFTGYFFKRWAYRAQDGTRLAPLLLARCPKWTPSTRAETPPDSLPSPLAWVALIGGTGLFAIGLATSVYWLSRRAARGHASTPKSPPPFEGSRP